MPHPIKTVHTHLARAYAWVDDQVASEDVDASQRAAAVALELYAAVAELAPVTGRVELIPDRPCNSASAAAAELEHASGLLDAVDAGLHGEAARHLAAAHLRLTADGSWS